MPVETDQTQQNGAMAEGGSGSGGSGKGATGHIQGLRYVTLIGTPLSQSFAPRMQNAAYRSMGLPIVYTTTEVDEHQLPGFLQRIREDPAYLGCAITKPNKVAGLPLLDALDPLCRQIGSGAPW